MATRIRLSVLCMLVLLAATASGVPGAEPQQSGIADATAARAAPDTASADAREPDAPEPGETLSVDQQQIADDFQHLQDLILRMAELSEWTDPRRAALLKRTFQQSQEKLIDVQFESLVELLAKDRLSRAIENQDNLRQDLEALLELLLSEDRARRAESEKARIRQYLKRLNRIINEQKGVQGRTAGSGRPGPLAEEQRKLADKTRDLAEDIKDHEAPTAGSAEDEQAKPAQAGDQKSGRPGGEGGKAKASKTRVSKKNSAHHRRGRVAKERANLAIPAGQSRRSRPKGRSRAKQKGKPTSREAKARRGNKIEANRRLSRKAKTRIRCADASKPPRSECARPGRNSSRPSEKKRSRSRKRPSGSWKRPRPSWSGSSGSSARRRSSGC